MLLRFFCFLSLAVFVSAVCDSGTCVGCLTAKPQLSNGNLVSCIWEGGECKTGSSSLSRTALDAALAKCPPERAGSVSTSTGGDKKTSSSTSVISIPSVSFTQDTILKKAVEKENCNGDDICIFHAVGKFLKSKVNVIDCGFQAQKQLCLQKDIVESAAFRKIPGADKLAVCTNDPVNTKYRIGDYPIGDPWIVRQCKSVTAVGYYKGCSLYAAFLGKDLTAEQIADTRCKTCQCDKRTPLKTYADSAQFSSGVWQAKYGFGKDFKKNTGTQEEHEVILSGLKDYWNYVVENQRGVCAWLAAALAFGARMSGVKGKIEWIAESYGSDGHEFVVYNRKGDLRAPTGGKIFDAWYFLLGEHLEAPLPLNEKFEGIYNTENWKNRAFFDQHMTLPAVSEKATRKKRNISRRKKFKFY